jgi:Escherichia/Staphylococcus phage prohead protease
MTLNRLLERRTVSGEVEVRAKGSSIYAEGYASVFEKRSGNLGGFVEKVRSSAFNKTIKEADVRALWNHDPQYVLGRTGAGTLELAIDSNGLYYRSLLPNTTYAKDLAALLERRDVRESSFTFFKVQDEWDLTEDGYPQRSLVEVGLIDVAPVTFPAYPDATSGVARRAALDGLARRCGIDGCMIESQLDTDQAILDAIKRLEPEGSTNTDTEPRNSTHDDVSPEARESTQQENSKLTQEQARKLKEQYDFDTIVSEFSFRSAS